MAPRRTLECVRRIAVMRAADAFHSSQNDLNLLANLSEAGAARAPGVHS
jgi:hypothetical protein